MGGGHGIFHIFFFNRRLLLPELKQYIPFILVQGLSDWADREAGLAFFKEQTELSLSDARLVVTSSVSVSKWGQKPATSDER